jgi:hypothetical protein
MADRVNDLANSHLHRCQNCGTVWGHGNMMAGDIEAHKCPNCGAEGKENWRIYRGGGSPVAQFPPHQAQPESSWTLFSVLNWIMLVGTLVFVGIVAWDYFARGSARRVSK